MILENQQLDNGFQIELAEQASTSFLNFDISQLGSIGNDLKGSFKNYFGKTSAIAAAKYAASKLIDKPKYNTFQLFSKDTFQKKLHTEIVGILLKSGNYKLVRKALMNGGELFELIKK